MSNITPSTVGGSIIVKQEADLSELAEEIRLLYESDCTFDNIVSSRILPLWVGSARTLINLRKEISSFLLMLAYLLCWCINIAI